MQDRASSKIALPVSVDFLRVRVPTLPQKRFISGTGFGTGVDVFRLPYIWTSVFRGPVGIKSFGPNFLMLKFNPSTLEHGTNLLRANADDLVSLVLQILHHIQSRLGFAWSRWEEARLRAGAVEVDSIHLAADYKFPSLQHLGAFHRHYLAWRPRWNRRRNTAFLTSDYHHATGWDLVVYRKDLEFDSKRSDCRSGGLRSAARLRSRIEVRIKRRDLRRLGERLHRSMPHFPTIDLTQLGAWTAPIADAAFDHYACRIRSSHHPQARVYDLLTRCGARPVWQRDTHESA